MKLPNLDQGFDGVKDAIKNIDINDLKNHANKAYEMVQENKHHLETAKNMGQ